jgi:hypothetical protein
LILRTRHDARCEWQVAESTGRAGSLIVASPGVLKTLHLSDHIHGMAVVSARENIGEPFSFVTSMLTMTDAMCRSFIVANMTWLLVVMFRVI